MNHFRCEIHDFYSRKPMPTCPYCTIEALKGEVAELKHYQITDNNFWRAEVASLTALNAKYQKELEHERVRLAGCGVAAMQNTQATVADRAKLGDYGYSASYSDVCKAVDREMKYREALERIERECTNRSVIMYGYSWARKIAREALALGEGV